MGFLDEIKKLAKTYDDDDEFFEDEEEEEARPTAEPAPAEPQPRRVRVGSRSDYTNTTGGSGKIVNIGATTQTKVILAKPERFESAAEIADHLREKRAVLMNLEKTNKDIARRLLDFLSGVAYALDGKIKRVSTNTYILTPYNIDLMGDGLADELESSASYF